jgi:hypothetical protein
VVPLQLVFWSRLTLLIRNFSYFLLAVITLAFAAVLSRIRLVNCPLPARVKSWPGLLPGAAFLD